MKNKIWQIYQYACYLVRSFHLHGIHSPFVFDLEKTLFREKSRFYAFDEIESLRAKLLLTEKVIEVKDLGAGSQKSNATKRSIHTIAKSALKSPSEAQLLFRLAYYFKPNTIIELGTSLGISTCYLAKAIPKGKVVTIEGAPKVAKVAAINFKKLQLNNIHPVVGNFDDVLEDQLKKVKRIDFFYIDGNHRKEATLNYFEKALQYSHEKTIVVLDDIYWSKEMTAAWKEIKKNPLVTITIDLFDFGLVFLKKDQAKQNFTVYH